MALRLRRGTDAERLLITPLNGELIYTTDTKLLYVGDGSTVGGTLVTGSGGGGSTTLNALTDTDLSGTVDGDVLAFNAGTNKWEPTTISGVGPINLDDLGDVTATSPQFQDILYFDGVVWNTSNGSFIANTISLNDLFDVSVPNLNFQDILYYNGVGWESANVADVLRYKQVDLDIKGSVFGSDSSLLVNGLDSKIVGDIDSTNATLSGNLVIEGTGGIVVNTNQSSDDPFDLFSINAAADTVAGSNIIFSKSRGSLSAKTGLLDGDDILAMTWFGYDPDGNPALSAAMSGYVQGTPSSGVVPGALALATTDSTGTFNIALSIGSDTVTRFGGALKLVSYADDTARDAAIPAPEPGMMIYLTSTNKAQVYDGTIWNNLY
jgi:hypothetical protein